MARDELFACNEGSLDLDKVEGIYVIGSAG